MSKFHCGSDACGGGDGIDVYSPHVCGCTCDRCDRTSNPAPASTTVQWVEDELRPSVEAEAAEDREYVMYLIVKSSIAMTPGKIAAQVGHAVETIAVDYASDTHYRRSQEECARLRAMRTWRHDQRRTKVVLQASDAEFELAKTIPGAVVVTDPVRAEVAPQIETVVGLWPMLRSERPNFLKRMRVLT